MIGATLAPESPRTLIDDFVLTLPDVGPGAGRYLELSAREFFRRSGVWRDQRLSVDVSAGDESITLPSRAIGEVDSVEGVWIVQGDLCEVELERAAELVGSGRVLWHSPSGPEIHISRAPSASHTLRVEARIVPNRSDYHCDADLLDRYRDTVIAGAAARATLAQGAAPENQRATAVHQFRFDQGVRRAWRVHGMNLSAERRAITRTGELRRRASGRRLVW